MLYGTSFFTCCNNKSSYRGLWELCLNEGRSFIFMLSLNIYTFFISHFVSNYYNNYHFSQWLWYISEIRISQKNVSKFSKTTFEQVTNAFVHPCSWFCAIPCCFLHYQLLMLIKMHYNGLLQSTFHIRSSQKIIIYL